MAPPDLGRDLTVSDWAIREVALKLGKGNKGDPRPADVVNAFETVQDRIRKYLLEKHYWSFASDLVKLKKSPETPPFGYSAFYENPPDFVSYTYVNDTGVLFEGLREWDPLRGKIAVNFEPVYASYTADIKDETLFSPSFLNLWIHTIAADICWPITKDKDLAADLEKKALALVPPAITINYKSTGRAKFRGREYLEAHSGVGVGEREIYAELPQSPIFPEGVPTGAQ